MDGFWTFSGIYLPPTPTYASDRPPSSRNSRLNPFPPLQSTARSMSPSFSDPSGSPTTTIASAAAAATAARREEQKRRDARIELRISIRCLVHLKFNTAVVQRLKQFQHFACFFFLQATTLWFFLHQMCTFLPGIFLYGCDQVHHTDPFHLGTRHLMVALALV